MCAYVCVHACVRMCVCMHVCVCVCACICVNVYVPWVDSTDTSKRVSDSLHVCMRYNPIHTYACVSLSVSVCALVGLDGYPETRKCSLIYVRMCACAHVLSYTYMCVCVCMPWVGSADTSKHVSDSIHVCMHYYYPTHTYIYMHVPWVDTTDTTRGCE